MKESIFVMLFFSGLSHAEIFKCVENGQVKYQDRPCTKAEVQLETNLNNNSVFGKSYYKKCGLETLKDGMRLYVAPHVPNKMVCGQPSGVTKEAVLKHIPNGRILPDSPSENIVFLQWETSRGYKYRMEYFKNDGFIHNAVLFPPDKTKSTTGTYINRSNDLDSAILNMCKSQWPGEYRQQEYCVKKQTEAAMRIGARLNDYEGDTVEKSIYNSCMQKWRKGKGLLSIDYRQADYCIEKEVESYHNLK
ncbi:DUF4124 domain-containing protein [Pseudoalteromonas sp. DL2-H2.2]|uniref:DUF4124 domain-containing protein n=1 Tax=Pseudoalteromonas sp. DL2-H2.2 TaxID=2908889 RepID=UPI001F428CF8|nr:DUF4124 domain-containing protein [Pseudoalteromonas sp. DL2-H2.2]MCF2908162.1 DUF4124 domain-containing protein [Pseudoalteromonas sp. DL2-H2.2]